MSKVIIIDPSSGNGHSPLNIYVYLLIDKPTLLEKFCFQDIKSIGDEVGIIRNTLKQIGQNKIIMDNGIDPITILVERELKRSGFDVTLIRYVPQQQGSRKIISDDQWAEGFINFFVNR